MRKSQMPQSGKKRCDDSTLMELHNIRIFQQEFYPKHSSAFPKVRQAHAFRLSSKGVSATISHR